jgi:hypothetical protein
VAITISGKQHPREHEENHQMKRTNSTKQTASKFNLTGKAMVAAVALMTFSTNVGAFSDGPALTQRIAIMLKEIKEYQAQLNQMKQQYTNLQKNLIPDFGMNFDLINGDDEMLKERGASEGMEIECPGAGPVAAGFAFLKNTLTLDPKGDIKSQQKELCQRIVLARNAQYNESVKILKAVREREQELKEINAEREAIGDEPGKLQSNTNKLNAVLNKSTIEMQYRTSVIQSYDSYIESLEQQQGLLGNQAMTGDSGNKTFAETYVKKFVQGAALKAALDRASSDR